MNKKLKVTFLILIIAGLVLAACGGGANDSASGFIEDDLNNQDDFQAPEFVVYGIDNRGEACQTCSTDLAHPNPELQYLSQGVAVLVRPEALSQNEDDTVQLLGYPLGKRIELTHGAPLCAEERFTKQLAPGFCTGFLVDSQTLVTAAHCIPNQAACENTRFVFNFQLGDSNQLLAIEAGENIFACQSLAFSETGEQPYQDIVIVTLDRQANFKPLILAEQIGSRQADSLAVIGHPSGLPQKIADDGQVLLIDAQEEYLLANLDTFAGSSGSPVISLKDYAVVGMLVGGEQDYQLTDMGCYAVKQCLPDAADCSGELVLSANYIQSKLSEAEEFPE